MSTTNRSFAISTPVAMTIGIPISRTMSIISRITLFAFAPGFVAELIRPFVIEIFSRKCITNNMPIPIPTAS